MMFSGATALQLTLLAALLAAPECSECGVNNVPNGAHTACVLSCGNGLAVNEAGSACEACPAGKRSGVNDDNCIDCSASSAAVAQSSSCTACVGSIPNVDQSECSQCPSNTYSSGLMTACQDCPSLSTSR